MNKDVNIKDYAEQFELTFSRIPGYEHLSHNEYLRMMEEKAEQRRTKIIEERLAEGKGFAGPEVLQAMEPCALPRNTKKSDRHTKRPLILTLNPEARKSHLDIYFRRLEAYKEASKKFRNGDLNAVFPPGTYRPPLFAPL